ncbi:phage integrase [Erwinia rhapontici]|uniref:phage integrase n=1 Tax=Erwinia rhapontici TaxID=55212 RepID=UPI00105EAAE7|nr:tyrosine-type recombinase/integrase [Erwinia rhapontici]TDS93443.1 site-specific recombinase XerD [Erwinia rhapontici]
MSIKTLDDGRYEVDIRPVGRDGKRIRRKFDRKSEARAFEMHIIATASKREEWHAPKAERRKLTDLVSDWFEVYGSTIPTGIIERRHLLKTAAHLGNPMANALTTKQLQQMRITRLNEGITASTINRDMYRLSGLFKTLIKMGEYKEPNPIEKLPVLKQVAPEVTFLMPDQINRLLAVLNGDERKVALLCLSTGARWSEASNLGAMQVRMQRVSYVATKNGKNRVVPISEELEKLIKTKATGKLFKVDYENFRIKLRTVVPDLPRGQATHVLRHTFASHFMINGGNIVTLRDILGHAGIQQTLIYAHFSPDFLQHAVTLNPLRGGIEKAY